MSKIKYDRENPKSYTVISRTSEFAKTRVQIQCPFCDTEFTAYVWSICGGGKKCPECGAMHGSLGLAYKVIKK